MDDTGLADAPLHNDLTPAPAPGARGDHQCRQLTPIHIGGLTHSPRSQSKTGSIRRRSRARRDTKMMQTAELATQLPTHGRPIKFTPERVQQIRNLVERGKSREEIAELIGVTVGSLQVTCSRLGISLRRVVFDNGMALLRRDRPHNGTSTYTASRRGGVPLPPISGQPQQNSQSGPVEQPQATTPHEERARTHEMDLATFALRMKYRGHERTRELPLTQDMIRQLAFEAQFRNMSMGELVGELLIAIMKRDIFQHVLQPNSKQP